MRQFWLGCVLVAIVDAQRSRAENRRENSECDSPFDENLMKTAKLATPGDEECEYWVEQVVRDV